MRIHSRHVRSLVLALAAIGAGCGDEPEPGASGETATETSAITIRGTIFDFGMNSSGRFTQPAGTYNGLDQNKAYTAITNSAWKAKGGVNVARSQITDWALNEVNRGLCGDPARALYSAQPGVAWCSEFAKTIFYWASNVFYPAPAIHDIRGCASRFLGSCTVWKYLFRDANSVKTMYTIFGDNSGLVGYPAMTATTPQPGDYISMDGGTGPDTHSAIVIGISDDLRYIWTVEGNNGDCVRFVRRDWVTNGSISPIFNRVGRINVAY